MWKTSSLSCVACFFSEKQEEVGREEEKQELKRLLPKRAIGIPGMNPLAGQGQIVQLLGNKAKSSVRCLIFP